MDADCCGDSGCILLASSSQPPQSFAAARPRSLRADGSLGSLLNKQVSVAACHRLCSGHQFARSPLLGRVLMHHCGKAMHALPATFNLLPQGNGSSNEDGPRKWACLSDGQAAVQLFWRLNHARQTVDFVRRQRAVFSRLDKLRLTIPQVNQEPFGTCKATLWLCSKTLVSLGSSAGAALV